MRNRGQVQFAGTAPTNLRSALFDYEVRIHAYAGSSRVRINHNYTCRLKQRTDPSAGRMRPVNPVPIAIKSMWLELPLRVGPVSSLRCGTATADSMTASLTRNGVEIRQWYCASGAIGAVQPRSDRFAAYDRNFDQALEGILKSRESERFFENRFGRYGLRNFGDNFGSDGMNFDDLWR